MKTSKLQNFMVFFILSATVALAYQIPYLRYTFYDQFATAYNLTNTQMGFIASALAFTNTICYPIGGIFADKFSTKFLMCLTLAAFVALSVVFALVTSYMLLIVIHVLFGFFGIATLWSAYLNGIRNLGDEGNQSKMFGSSEATRGIVQTIMGFAYLGIVGAAATEIAGMRMLLFFSAAVSAVLLVLAIIFLPNDKKDKTKKATESVQTSNEKKYTIGDILKNKGVWITILIVMFAYIVWQVGNTYLSTYTVQVLQISTETASAIGIVRSYIIVLLAGFIGGFVMDKFTYKGKGFILMFGLSIVIVAAVMATSKVVPVCIAMTLVIAFLANIMKSTYWSVMDQAGIPVGMTAMATGIISFIAFIPDFLIGPICGTWLDNAEAAGNIAAGFNNIFIFLIVSGILGILSSILLMRHTKSLENKKTTEEAVQE